MSPDFLDRFSRGNTVCHRLPPRFKIGAALAVIVLGLVVPIAHWPIHGCLICIAFAALGLARIPLRYVLHRLGMFLPFVLLLSISVPAAHRFHHGWDLFAALVVRSTLSLLAGLWLVNVTPFDQILSTLRRSGVPVVLIAILAFMYRYLFVVFDELSRMRDARRARSFNGQRGWKEWRTSAQLIAMLLIRSLERAERVYGAMCARGWDGHVRTIDAPGDR